MPASFFHRTDIGKVVGHTCSVVHAVCESYNLHIGATFGELFRAAMQVAEHRLDVHDNFAIEGNAQPEDPVRAGVLWAQVYCDRLSL